MKLLTAFAIATLCVAGAAQSTMATLAKRLAIPVVAVHAAEGGAVAHHADGSFTAVILEGSTMTLSFADLARGPQGNDQIITPELPCITTRYIDAKGNEHEIKTPIESSTEAGLKRAMLAHKALFDVMQKLFPPKKPA